MGLKVTPIVQASPAATEVPQLFDVEKSLAFEPETAMLLTLKLAFPELARVTVCAGVAVPLAWLTKARLVGVSVTAGAEARTAEFCSRGGAFVQCEICGGHSPGFWLEGDADCATCTCRHAVSTIVGLGKIAGVGPGEREAGNAQCAVARYC